MKVEHPQNLKRKRHGALILDERGGAMIMVAVALFATFAFAVLAIDAPILMVSRTQLQSAADAAALAGASGLVLPLDGIDFSGANLRGADLRGAP